MSGYCFADLPLGVWVADARRVDQTSGDGWEVSTVHLVVYHQWGNGPPPIFETTIFGGEHDNWCDRYSTEAEAQAGHDRVVAALRAGEAP